MIDKQYKPRAVEEKIIQLWDREKCFEADNKSTRPKFSIAIPPPNVTGNLTIGHVLNNTIQDIYARLKRMQGYNVLWLPGVDHAGIATQTVVEKRLREYNITRYDLGREKFVEKVWQWKEEYHSNIRNQLKRMGASVDWSRERFTLDEGLSKAVRKVFVDFYRKGLIYRGKRIINWDPVQQTALSDEEVIYNEKRGKIYFIKYPLYGESDKYIIVATTRPETMLGDTAVAVNPEDPRYRNFIGKKVLLPLADRVIPIIGDDYVDTEFGTGALKVTPAHDTNDFELGLKYNLEMVQVIDHSGRMNSHAGRFSGLDRFEAREIIVRELTSLGLIEKIEDYVHNVGYSERGGTQIEPFLSDQWFVKMKPLAEPALNAVLSGNIRFYPARWTKTYEHWMTNIKDWCISRQLWWGHQIPVWYNKSTGDVYCDIEPPTDPENWEQDPDVLDTWFSSWLWPFSTLGWPDETEDLKIYFPTDLLSTGADIIFFWVARMIMASLEFTGKIPFKDVYFHNIIRDEKGRKLSKSLGNSPDVTEVINKYGADALRFTLVYLAPQGTDIYFSENKCELGRNFANKLWNAARFLLINKPETGEVADYDIFDKWIKSRFNSALRDYTKALESYRINDASKILYDFIWNDFCDWYIEIIKIRASLNTETSSGSFKLAGELFRNILKLLHPVMPLITEELWQYFKCDSHRDMLCVSRFPELKIHEIDDEVERSVIKLQEVISELRKMKKEAGHISGKTEAILSFKDTSNKEFFISVSQYIINLAKLSSLDFDANKAQDRKWISSILPGVEIFISRPDNYDPYGDKMKLTLELNQVSEFVKKLESKLSNENFISKAPAAVVDAEKKKLEDQRVKLDKIRNKLKELESTYPDNA